MWVVRNSVAAVAAVFLMAACSGTGNKSESEAVTAKKDAKAVEKGEKAEKSAEKPAEKGGDKPGENKSATAKAEDAAKAALTGKSAKPGAKPAASNSKSPDPALGSCKDEAKKYCGTVQHELKKAVACLEQHKAQLAPACKTEIEKLKKLHL